MNLTFCTHCGTKHTQNNYPKKCNNCESESFQNPIPVIVLLVPVAGEGVLIQKRNIEPAKGKYALISGYMDKGETPEQTATREAFEECGVQVKNIRHCGFKVSKSQNLLILMECDPVNKEDIKFSPNAEVSDISFLNKIEELAFEAHSEFIKQYFNAKKIDHKTMAGW